MVKKKWLEKGGVAPSNGVDSGSLCDKVRGVLKGANDSVEVRVSESGMRKIQEILETAINNGGQDEVNKIPLNQKLNWNPSKGHCPPSLILDCINYCNYFLCFFWY